MVKAVIFDIDGVLVDSRERNVKLYRALLSAAGYRKPARRRIASLYHVPLMDTLRELLPHADEEEIGRVRSCLRLVHVPDTISEVPKDARSVLVRISKQYSLGIATSRIRVGVTPVLKLLRASKLFQVSVTYDDCAKTKPNPEPLLLAAKLLRVKPSQAVYVGDARTDFLAARRAGMKFVLYGKEQIVRCRYRAESFTELEQVIAELDGK